MLTRVRERIDRAQLGSRSLAIAIATFKKFSEDHTSNLAAMVAFWGFFSIFPLLLVLVTVLGWVLPAGDKASVLTHVANMFPLVDPSTVSHLSGAVWALLVGLISALWSGIGVVRTMQSAFDSVWEVPYRDRLGTRAQLVRSVWVLGTIGVGLVVSTLVSSLATSTSNGLSLGVAGRVAGYLIAVALDVGLVVAGFRILTTRHVTVRDVLPGGLVAGVAFFVLQELSAFIISAHLKNAQSTYGHFATVITILWWFYLQAQITLLAGQLNVVLRDRLYPRSLGKLPRTEADHRALTAYAAERAYQPKETVNVEFEQQAS